MKRLIISVLLFTALWADLPAAEISRVEPPFWWVGMKNTTLQIMIYGSEIGKGDVRIEPYPGVKLERVAKCENNDYLFIYLNVSNKAKPGTLKINITGKNINLTREYELLKREVMDGARGFSQADVLYLIMPDRFANGDPENDNWGEDLSDRMEPFARHGGDFAGIGKHLDYMKSLGVTAIWLNPVLENKMPENRYRSYHGYATTDYYNVDRRFGSNEDYKKLIGEIHKSGMKMVMDMIFNHCGSYHWWMKNLPCNDWLNHQDGFVSTSHNSFAVADIHAPESEKRAMTDGWFVEAMPDLNQRNPLLADYLIQNSIWWIEYSQIDGIRHDTHPYADFDFLSEWCRRVTEEYPNFNIVGESWYTLPWWQQKSKVNPRETNLKTVMDFNLMLACADAFPADTSKRFALRKVYEVIAQDFLYSDWRNILTFLDNHDVSRFTKSGENSLDRFKQAFGLILTTRGIPQIYYGSEILMYGEKSEGDGLLRKDFPGGWREDKVNLFNRSERSTFQNEAFNYLSGLLKWRAGCKAVTEGDLIHYAPDDYNFNCYIYGRVKGESRVLVVLNGENRPMLIDPNRYREVIGTSREGVDVTTGRIISLNDRFTIHSKGIYILELK